MTNADEFGTEMQAIADVGASLIFGTVGADGAPRAARAWSVAMVDQATRRLRIAVTADDDGVVANLANGVGSLTIADIRTFRARQLKGRIVSIEPPSAADRQQIDAQTESFFVAVTEIDHSPREGLLCMLPLTVVMVDLVVAEQFDQTPGPSAGTSVGTSR